MALSYGQFFGTGSQENFDAPFEYLSKQHVKVRVNGNIVPFTWVSTYTVKVTPAPAMSAVVEVRRETPRDVRLVAFTDGSTLVETDLNVATLQSFFLAQEAFDQGAASLSVTEDGAYSAGLRRISNVSDPTQDQDVVTRKWATTSVNSNVAQAISARNDAQTARTGAETARDAANSHRASAFTHLNNAIAARDVAVAAQTDVTAKQGDVVTRQADVVVKHGEVRDWRDLTLGYRNETQAARDTGVAAKDTAVAAKDVVVGYTADLYRQTILSSPTKTPVLADKIGLLNSASGDTTVQITLAQLKTLMIGTSGVPTGAIAAFLDGAIPAGWAPLEGQTLSRTGETAALFALWGTKYGPGNGTSTYNVPDTRGEWLRGWDNGRNVDPGRVLGSFQDWMLASHNHGLAMDWVPDHVHELSLGGRYGANSGFAGPRWGAGDRSSGSGAVNVAAAGGHTPTGTVQYTGGTEQRVRGLAVRWCVKL